MKMKTQLREAHHYKHICVISLDLEFIIGNVVTYDTVLCNVNQTDNSTWWCVSETCKCNTALHELFSLVSAHVFAIVCINVTPHEGSARAAEGPVALLKVTWRVYLVDLVTFVWVPSTADHGCRQRVLVRVNDFSHHSSSGLYRWQTTELWGLDVHVISNVTCDGAGIRWGAWTLTVNSLMDWLQLIRDTIAHIHVLKDRIWLRTFVNLHLLSGHLHLG